MLDTPISALLLRPPPAARRGRAERTAHAAPGIPVAVLRLGQIACQPWPSFRVRWFKEEQRKF